MSILTNPPTSPPEEPFEHPREVLDRADRTLERIEDQLTALEDDIEGGFDEGAFTPEHAAHHEELVDAIAKLSAAWGRTSHRLDAFRSARLARRITEEDLR